MREYWINVYLNPGGMLWYGIDVRRKETSVSLAAQSIANGCKLLYRIHVRLK